MLQDLINFSENLISRLITAFQMAEGYFLCAKEVSSKDELAGKRYEAGIFVLHNSTPCRIKGRLIFLVQYLLYDSFLTNRVKAFLRLLLRKY
jgi:hypothetical protein